jgi:hypothetical protein
MVSDSILQQLHDLKQAQIERSLELMGVDVAELRALEAEYASQYDELFVQVRESLRDAGQGIPEQHSLSLERSNLLFEAAQQPTLPGLEQVPPWIRDGIVGVYLPCYHPNTAKYVGHSSSVTQYPPSGEGTEGYVVYLPPPGADDAKSHGLTEARGRGTGTESRVQVSSKHRYAFTPPASRTYCILPMVHISGHWLVWAWGTCAKTPNSQGAGKVQVKLRVRVDQLSVPVKQSEHTVLEESQASRPTPHSGFAYTSDRGGGAALKVFLQGGHEAVVWVECECSAQVTNHGRAWVDLETSPNFYFWVPEVRWGWPDVRGWYELGYSQIP